MKLQKVTSAVNHTTKKVLHGRRVPPSYAYQQISNVELDIEPFEDQSDERNRSESELSDYLSSLYKHVHARSHALPKYNHKNKEDTSQPLFKPLYNYEKTKTTETDTRPSYHKFMSNLEKSNPTLFEELSQPLPTEQLIDMNYLKLRENKNVPKILPDDEYPQWVWELVPESRKYWWTDLVQTPFENLSQKEKFRLLRKWRKTLMVSNNQWNKSHLGYLGKTRPKYNDPWPRPITKMDIGVYQQDDVHYQVARSETNMINKRSKNKKRLETDADYLRNQNLIPNSGEEGQYELLEYQDDDDEPQTIDLVKYYGMQDADINIDNDDMKDSVVYDVKMNQK